MAWQPPFGYIKDPNDKHKIIVDDEVAHIVREAFELSLKGMSTRKLLSCLMKRITSLHTDERNKPRGWITLIRQQRLRTIKSQSGCMEQSLKSWVMKITLEHTAITWFRNQLLVVESQYQFQEKIGGVYLIIMKQLSREKCLIRFEIKIKPRLLRMWTILN